MTYSHVLWDFNGTILNDLYTGIKCANALLQRRNMKTMKSLDDYYNVFCFPIINYYEKLGFDFEKESYEKLAIEWVEEYKHYSKDSTLHEGIEEVLSHIKKRNIPQYILSATEKNMLFDQVEELGINNYFDDILGLDNIHAYSKVDIAKDWKNKTSPNKAVLIGDTVHDFEVSKELGIDCILIANGHQSKELLSTCGVKVIDSVRELLILQLV